ncbi:hypothetical protein [Lactococcus lactis]|uniref:Uncharacterized protein n=1 Tax=Lactococcus lactis TaxID=1358 RepID=A0A6M0MAV3_9LACT|nr:hypothetical protein [Lactococcus lactis]NEX50214.1 hypothetical protein [Lactococcus lactis]NEX56275.1 hypothetical protein [Lactococcus lactis]
MSLKIKSYTVYGPEKQPLFYHNYLFNDWQNKAVNIKIMKFRNKYIEKD